MNLRKESCHRCLLRNRCAGPPSVVTRLANVVLFTSDPRQLAVNGACWRLSQFAQSHAQRNRFLTLDCSTGPVRHAYTHSFLCVMGYQGAVWALGYHGADDLPPCRPGRTYGPSPSTAIRLGIPAAYTNTFEKVSHYIGCRTVAWRKNDSPKILSLHVSDSVACPGWCLQDRGSHAGQDS